jgi:outer membrane protein
MKRILTLLIAVMVSGLVLAQQQAQPQQQTFTLDECIEYALTNAINAQNARIDQEVASARVKEVIGMGLPQINIASTLAHNPQLPRFFMAYNPASPIGPGNIPGVNEGDVMAMRNFFQLQSNGDANAQVNQLIFNGSYIVGLQATSAYRELADKSALRTNEEIIQGVMKAYYGVLINKERITLFDANIARVDTTLRNTKALHQNGFAESIDVDRIQVTYNNLVAERDKFLKMNVLGQQLLKFQMNYPLDQPINIVGSIQDVKVDTDLSHYEEGWDYKIRPDYQVLVAQHRMQELNVKNQYAGAFPTIGAFARWGVSTQSNNVAGIFRTNSTFDLSEAGIGKDTWYSYSMIGVSLNWNIFTGLQRNYKIQQEKLNLKKIDNGFVQLKTGIDLETERAGIFFQNAIATLRVQKENMDLAANVARVTKIKYEQGIGSNLELVDAEGSLKEAQNNYYTSMFDAMIAKVDLDKAYGKLIRTPASTSNK